MKRLQSFETRLVGEFNFSGDRAVPEKQNEFLNLNDLSAGIQRELAPGITL